MRCDSFRPLSPSTLSRVHLILITLAFSNCGTIAFSQDLFPTDSDSFASQLRPTVKWHSPNSEFSSLLVSHRVAWQPLDDELSELSLSLPDPNPEGENGDTDEPEGEQSENGPEELSPPDGQSSPTGEPDDSSQKSLADHLKKGGERMNQRLDLLRKPANQLRLVPHAIATEDQVVPDNRAAEVFASQPEQVISGTWHPTLRAERVHVPFCHRPTYFQELNLERCGQTDCGSCGCLQNAISSFWFLGNAFALPYRIATQPPCQCVSAYGDCTACSAYAHAIEPLGCTKNDPSSVRGALAQAASMAGFAFLIL